MPVFAYKAFDAHDDLISGTVIADSPRQARDQVRARGLLTQEVRPYAVGRVSLWRQLGNRLAAARHHAQMVQFIRELSTLLGVGVPLLEAIDILADQYGKGFRPVLLQLREQIASGISLADAMKAQPHIFDEFCINVAQVGQDAGTLDSSLARLAEFKERSRQFQDRIGTALIYPCIVLTMAIAVSIFLMTLVVPNLLNALIQAGKPLPLPTRIVKAISDFLLYRWDVLLLMVVTLGTGVSLILHHPQGRFGWHRFLLWIPVLGTLIRKQAIVRVATVLAILLKSGIVFVRALQIAQRSTGNLVIRDALVRCEEAVQAGRDISVALADTGVFPPMVIQIFAVGQRSGRLEEMLERLVRDYDLQVQTAANRLTAILEPALVILMVFLVGLIAFATILPMLEASNVL